MYRILVCDDEKDIVSALKIYLMADGYQVFEAYSGAQALEVLEKEDIHLVLLDVMMPQMDGLTALARVRQVSNVPTWNAAASPPACSISQATFWPA